MTVWIILGIAFVSLVTTFVLSGVCADIASDKGYDWYSAFWLCFFLGFAGCFLVAARPDRKMRERAECLEYVEALQ